MSLKTAANFYNCSCFFFFLSNFDEKSMLVFLYL